MISAKQTKILAFPYSGYDALICDGAIRSGKTSIMMVAYVDWAMRSFTNRRFIIGGKTVEAATRNVVEPYIAMSYAQRRYKIRWLRGRHRLEVRRGQVVNYFDVFGGNDESSYMLVQGFTAAGCLLDEVAILARSFVEQCLARCSVEGSRFFFNCNPSNPNHWFKREWIDQLQRHNALYIRFSLRDNPSLSERMIQRYESMYTGIFRQRYIDGLWVMAEGLVYGQYADGQLEKECRADRDELCYVSVDYGISNPFVALLWKVVDGVAYCCEEYAWDGREGNRLTDSQHYENVRGLIDGRAVDCIVVDPSATSFIEEIRAQGEYDVIGADNSVLAGIARVSTAMEAGCIKIDPSCQTLLKELTLYRWDEKAKQDKVIKEDDHACDALRYFVSTLGYELLGCFFE